MAMENHRKTIGKWGFTQPGYVKIAIENGHRNSWCSHWTLHSEWDFPACRMESISADTPWISHKNSMKILLFIIIPIIKPYYTSHIKPWFHAVSLCCITWVECVIRVEFLEIFRENHLMTMSYSTPPPFSMEIDHLYVMYDDLPIYRYL